MAMKSWKTLVGLLVLALTITSIAVIPAMADDSGNATPAEPSGQDESVAPPPARPQVGERCEEYLGKVADNLGVSGDALDAAMVDAAKQMVDEAVAEGKLTAEQGEQIKANIDERGACGLIRLRPLPQEPELGALDRAVEEGIITQEQADEVTAILQQIRDYVQENGAPGHGPRGYSIEQMLDKAVEEGIITQEQADTAMSILEQIRENLPPNPCRMGRGQGPQNGENPQGFEGGAFHGFGMRSGHGMTGVGTGA